MSDSVRSSRSVRDQANNDSEINVTPLMDVVFILLVFFVVTTTFIKESGMDVSRPSSAPQAVTSSIQIALYIQQDGQYRINGRSVSAASLGPNLERQMAVSPDANLVIISARAATTSALVLALDEARLAGIDQISVATSTQD